MRGHVRIIFGHEPFEAYQISIRYWLLQLVFLLKACIMPLLKLKDKFSADERNIQTIFQLKSDGSEAVAGPHFAHYFNSSGGSLNPSGCYSSIQHFRKAGLVR